MNKNTQIEKAERFAALHRDSKLLIMPNIWDPLGARLLQDLGYPAVATASAAVAFSLGFDDGEKIRFEAMLEAIRRVIAVVEVPVTADVEKGYAESPSDVAGNVRRVLEAGAVGINLEDSVDDSSLRSIEDQCARIRAVRTMADGEGIPLFINARTDVYLQGDEKYFSQQLKEVLERSRAYRGAGADGIYPIGLTHLESLETIAEETGAPVNVYASRLGPSVQELEGAGVSRLTVGPGLLKVALTVMKRAASDLKEGDVGLFFPDDLISSEEIRSFVSSEKMT